MAAPSGPHSPVSDIDMVPAEIGTDKTELSTPSQVYESPSYNVTAHTLNDHEQAPLGLDLHPQTSSSVDYSVGPPSPIEALRRFSARLIPRPSSNSTGRDHPEKLPGVGERGGVVGEHPKVEGRDSTRINRARRPKTRPPTARSDPYEDENRKKYYRGSLFRSKSFTLREDSAQSAITSPSGSPASPLSSSYHTARDFYQLGLDARSSYYPDFTENSSFYTALEGNSVVHSPWPKRRGT
ncbi:hypothetical protein FRB99_003753 [Tulasnella sp. 403]|nr:hypothetical protein FRB99_003753 [Tulasnella sp. 403]